MLTALLFAAALQPDIEVGQTLTPPAQVAGPWEALVAPGKVAGFSLQIITNANEKVRSLNLDTYVRKEGNTTRTWWSNGDAAGALLMRTGRLQFHQRRSANEGFDVTLDVTYDPIDMAWKGFFRDPFFSGHVALHRPNFSDSLAPVGTWRTYSEVTIWPTQRVEEYGCLNIGVGQDGALILWAESHNLFLGDAKQPIFGDSYGELYDDSQAEHYGDEWSFMAGTQMGGDRITGVPSSDGSSFGGYEEHYGNGTVDPSRPRRPFAWTRMLNLACRP